ncbi:hypothetical protein SLEP1_g32810 [Rubroshorea leprosula]|uniref:Uncharacterized protein n=1 Tax=Rubroshorea leprosula TaxID=152421 RepID=A0AAV5KEL3_9ROSI|nr:hypothetical protein SLEP1_g32810 [Rubroshorea leprosula]
MRQPSHQLFSSRHAGSRCRQLPAKIRLSHHLKKKESSLIWNTPELARFLLPDLHPDPQVGGSPSTSVLVVIIIFFSALAFFFQIFTQILRSVGHHPLLSSSSSSTHRFKPFPVVDLPETKSPLVVEIVVVFDFATTVTEEKIEKLMVVLDLDETLVCAYETSTLPLALRNQATEAGLKWFELEYMSSNKDSILTMSFSIFSSVTVVMESKMATISTTEGDLIFGESTTGKGLKRWLKMTTRIEADGDPPT